MRERKRLRVVTEDGREGARTAAQEHIESPWSSTQSSLLEVSGLAGAMLKRDQMGGRRLLWCCNVSMPKAHLIT